MRVRVVAAGFAALFATTALAQTPSADGPAMNLIVATPLAVSAICVRPAW